MVSLADISAGISAAEATFAQIKQSATSLVEGAIGNVESGFSSLAAGVSNVLNNGAQSEQQRANTFAAAKSSPSLSGGIGAVSEGLTALASSVGQNIGSAATAIGTGLGSLSENVNAPISAQLTGVGDGLSGLEKTIQDILAPLFKDVEDVLDRLFHLVFDPIKLVLDNVEHFLEVLVTDTEKMGQILSEAIHEIPVAIAGLRDFLNKPIDYGKVAREAMNDPLNPLEVVRGAINAVLVPAVHGLLGAAGFNASALSGPALDRIVETAVAQQLLQTAEERLGAQGFIIANLIDKVSDPLLSGAFRELEYAGNQTQPNRILDLDTQLILFHRGVLSLQEIKEELTKDGFDGDTVNKIVAASYRLNGMGDLVQAFFRGSIASEEDFTRRAKKIGYAAEDVSEFLEVSRPLLSTGDMISMFHRGVKIEGDTDAFDDLRRQGWTEERIAAYQKISFQLPNIFNIQDFAVRQVDNPEIVRKFRLDERRDDAYMAGARKLGYTDEDAIRYYRYYWEYPPFFQVARLYSSGKISETDFRDILGFLRFTTYFADLLVEDLKPRLTEAEIREQYKYQLIDAEQLLTELIAFGLTPELAKAKRDLWVSSVALAHPLEATATAAKAERAQGLTSSLIIRAYRDHVYMRDDTLALLVKIGLGPDEAAIHLKIADYDQHKADVEQEIATLKSDLSAGLISDQDAVDEIQKLGLTSYQVDRYIAEFARMTKHKPKTPTIAEFSAWHKKAIISDAEFSQALRILGYDDSWIPYFLLASGVSAQGIADIGITATTALS